MLWVNLVVAHMPKGARYTMGARIEHKFLELLELLYIAYFTNKESKPEKIDTCILKLDTLKFLISVAWEAKFISHTHFEQISVKLDEVGKMLGGWKKNLEQGDKKNRTL